MARIPATSLATSSVGNASGSGTRLGPSPHHGQHHPVRRHQTRNQFHRVSKTCRELNEQLVFRFSPEFSPIPHVSGSTSREILFCPSYEISPIKRSKSREAFPGGSEGRLRLRCGMPRFNPWVGSIPWKREWQPTPVILPGEFHGQRSLAGCSPWGHEESDSTCPASGKSKVTSIVGGGGSAHLLRGRGRSPWAEPWAEVLQKPRLTLKKFFCPVFEVQKKNGSACHCCCAIAQSCLTL